MRNLLLLTLLLCVGCTPQPADVESFVPVLCIVSASADDIAPPSPSPTPDGECATCGGKGWKEDNGVKFDCPDCENDWKRVHADDMSEERVAEILERVHVTPTEAPQPPSEVSSATPGDGQSQAMWRESLKAAEEEVKDDPRRVVFVYITQDGCPPCRKFLREMVEGKNEEHAQQLREWWERVSAPVKINKSVDLAQATALGGRRVPHFVLYRPGGKVEAFTGFTSFKDFNARFKKAHDEVTGE